MGDINDILNKSGIPNKINPVTVDEPYKYRLVVSVQSYYVYDGDERPYKTFTYVLESKPFNPKDITINKCKIFINTVECIEVTECPINIEWSDTTQIRVKEKEDKPIYDFFSGTKPIIEQKGFTFKYVNGNFNINDEEIKAMLRETMTWATGDLHYNMSYILFRFDNDKYQKFPKNIGYGIMNTRYGTSDLKLIRIRDNILSVTEAQTQKPVTETQQPVTEAQTQKPVTEIQPQPVNEEQVSTEIQTQPVTEIQPQTTQTTSGGRKRKTKKTHKKRKMKKHHKKRKTTKK